MVLLLAVSSLLLALLSPFIGYLFLISVGGSYLYKKETAVISISGLLILGVTILWYMGLVTPMEVGDIAIGVALVMYIFIKTLRIKKDYINAFFYAGILQVLYGIVRNFSFSSIFKERLETFFLGYQTFLQENIGIGDTVAESTEIFDTIQGIMIDYQVAIWGITMLLGMYVAMVFLAKRLDISWEHQLIRFPYWFSYVLIIALVLAILPETRLIGINGLLMIMVFFLIQGLSVIDFIATQHLKKSRFIMIATVTLMVINFFFALMIAALGLLDYWMDIRKLNH